MEIFNGIHYDLCVFVLCVLHIGVRCSQVVGDKKKKKTLASTPASGSRVISEKIRIETRRFVACVMMLAGVI